MVTVSARVTAASGTPTDAGVARSPRTTASRVREALNADTTEYSDTDLEQPIALANGIVDRDVLPNAEGPEATTPGLPSALEDVERYLAALIAVSERPADRTVKAIEQNSASVRYADSGDVSSAGRYWQLAVFADPTDTLGGVSGSATVI